MRGERSRRVEYRKYKATFHGATFHGTPAGASQQPAVPTLRYREPSPAALARQRPALPAAGPQARPAGTDRTGPGDGQPARLGLLRGGPASNAMRAALRDCKVQREMVTRGRYHYRHVLDLPRDAMRGRTQCHE